MLVPQVKEVSHERKIRNQNIKIKNMNQRIMKDKNQTAPKRQHCEEDIES